LGHGRFHGLGQKESKSLFASFSSEKEVLASFRSAAARVLKT
jgi:hypothetical protein